MDSNNDPRLLLEWEEQILGAVPKWKAEPDQAIVARLAYRHLKLTPEEIQHSSTQFEFQGAFNKLYAINCPKGAFFMRVTLPVDPAFKTLSEVATLAYVSEKTSIPVPKVIACDASCDTELHFEYILMERISGESLDLVWPSLSWEQKVALVHQVAVVKAQMQGLQFERMGSLFSTSGLSMQAESRTTSGNTSCGPIVDRLVSLDFFWKTHFLLDVPRGPFNSEREWLQIRIDFAEDDLKQMEAKTGLDEEDQWINEDTRETLDRLRSYRDTLFPPGSESDVFYLHHNDISQKNLVVSSAGELKALVDWECVSTCPSWKTHQYPQFLVSKERHEKPDAGRYIIYEDGSPNEVLLDHQEEYECTLLRRIFADKMDSLITGWSSELRLGQPKRDFDQALDGCDGGFDMRDIQVWLDYLDEGGEYIDLARAVSVKMGI